MFDPKAVKVKGCVGVAEELRELAGGEDEEAAKEGSDGGADVPGEWEEDKGSRCVCVVGELSYDRS